MGGGEHRPSSKSSNWAGYPKKRCANIGCKRKARHILKENKKIYCKFCFKNLTVDELLISSGDKI